jgi:hypothetical protein
VAFSALRSALIPRAADESDITLPLYGVSPAPHGALASQRGLTIVSPLDRRLYSPTTDLASSASDSTFALIELPADVPLGNGSYRRPHHAFGYRWRAAESWLHDQGVDAQNCYLPMMRLNTKLSASGASGTVWVYGRCSFK